METPVAPISSPKHNKLHESGTCIFACPLCFDPFTLKADLIFSLDSTPGTSLECKLCNKTFSGEGTHLDMTTVTGGVEVAAQFFRLPVVPFIYERGWRQSFSLFWGFPGPNKEFEMMKEHLKAGSGGKIVDASCGSGLLSRRFAKSGMFSLVIALDFSEAMLQQCYDFIKQEKDFPEEKIILVRAEISRLPFVTNSIDVVHAGAALHCWPSPAVGVQEIRRILRPGGIFIATTVILDGCCFPTLKQSKTIRLSKYQPFRFFRSEKELEDLCTSSGFINFKCIRVRRFVMIFAMKPM